MVVVKRSRSQDILRSSGHHFPAVPRKGFGSADCDTTMLIRFVYRTAKIAALSRSLDSKEIYISCSVHKCELLNIYAIYLSLCTQTADPNSFRATYCI